MTRALCLACGGLKFEAFCPCQECGHGSTGDPRLDILFSDHTFAPSTLHALGDVIRQIRASCDEDEIGFWTFIKYFSDSHPDVITARVPEGSETSVVANLKALDLRPVELVRSERYEMGFDRSALHTETLTIARSLGAQEFARDQLTSLGTTYWHLGRLDEAIYHHEQAVVLAREIGDRRGEGESLGCIGNDFLVRGDCERAMDYFEQALDIARETGDRENEANWLMGMGNATFLPVKNWSVPRIRLWHYPQIFRMARTVRRAMPFYEQAAEIAAEIGNRSGEGASLGNLGNTYLRIGRMQRAIPYYEQALAIAREAGDRANEAGWLRSLGNAYGMLKQPERALEYYEQAWALGEELWDAPTQATFLYNMGLRAKQARDLSRAREIWSEALLVSETMHLPIGSRVREMLAQLPDRD